MSLSVYIRTAPELISEVVLKMGEEFIYIYFTRDYSNTTEITISVLLEIGQPSYFRKTY